MFRYKGLVIEVFYGNTEGLYFSVYFRRGLFNFK